MELYAQYKTKLEFLNLDLFDVIQNNPSYPVTTWGTEKNEEGKYILKHNNTRLYSNDGVLVLNDIFKRNTFYNLTIRVDYIADTKYKPIIALTKGSVDRTRIRGSYKLKTGINNITLNTYDQIDLAIFSDKSAYFAISEISFEEATYEKLDVDANENILLSKSLKDIKNPDKISGEYSKTFNLPSTTINDRYFGYLKNIDATGYFNVKTKIRASIEDNGMFITDGTLQLVTINTEDGVTTYEVIFRGPTTTFFSKLKDKKLNEIDSSEIEDHIYDIYTSPEYGAPEEPEKIDLTCSWEYSNGTQAKAANFPYTYSLIDKGMNINKEYFSEWHNFDKSGIPYSPNSYRGFSVEDFTIHMYNWYLFDKIHKEFGYTYEVDLDDMTDFNDLAIPVSSELYRDFVIDEPQFKITGKRTYYKYGYEGNINWCGKGAFVNGSGSANNKKIIVSDQYNGDTHSSNVYNIGSVYYIMTPKKSIKRKFKLTFRYKDFAKDGASVVRLSLYFVNKRNNGYSIYSVPVKVWSTAIEMNTIINDDTSVDTIINTPYVDVPIEIEIPELLLRGIDVVGSNKNGSYFYFQAVNIGSYSVSFHKVEFTLESIEDDIDDSILLPGDNFSNPCKWLDSKTSCLDYIKTLTTLFNLYVDVDENEKHISYRIYNNYYEEGDTKDFTHKLAKDQTIQKTFISELSNRRLIYKHSNSQDVYNKDYKDATEDIYGTFKLDSENEFVDGDSTITTKLLPSISRTIDFDPYFCNIVDTSKEFGKYDNNIGFRLVYPRKIKLSNSDTIYYGALNLLQWSWHTCFISNECKYRAGAGNFSLNFEKPDYYYTSKGNSDAETVINKYHQDYLNVIFDKDSYMLTVMIKLTSNEYANLSLKDTIIIDNQSYIINNIKDFNPNKLTEIELIKK